jgi:amino acid adenylation domain-containing protein
MITEARARVLLTDQRLGEAVGASEVKTVYMDAGRDAISRHSTQSPRTGVTSGNLAYVIFTSGSTGKPKGVMVEHGSVCNLVEAQIGAFQISGNSRVLQFASFSFDAAVSEIFTALVAGATLCLIEKEKVLGGPALARLMKDERITTVTLPPSVLLSTSGSGLAELNTVVSAGEACSWRTFKQWEQGRRFINAYGPTEAAVCATLDECEQEERMSPSIGKPIQNMQVRILDQSMNPVPVGVAGELMTGGTGVGRGYANKPDLTAERFIPDPYGRELGARFYRTGDRCRYLIDGRIEFLGRIDNQVKIRGFRIELSEVESALREHQQVRDAAVVAVEGELDDKRLTAFLVAAGTDRIETSELRSHLRQRLPDFMVPVRYVPLDELPLMPNGKVDRKKLQAGELSPVKNQIDYEEPANSLQRWLAQIWEELLGIERIGINQDFFELGGESIKAAILINRLQQELGAYVYVVALFDAPTIKQLSDYLWREYPEAVRKLLGDDFEYEEPIHSAAMPEMIDEEKIGTIARVVEPPIPVMAVRQVSRKSKRPAVFLLSPPRSGSTLLRVMMGGHPSVFAPPELELLGFTTLQERTSNLNGKYSFWLEGTIRAIMQIKGCDAGQARELMQRCEAEAMTTGEFYQQIQEWIGERWLVDKTPSYALNLATLMRAEEIFEEPKYIHLLRHPYAMIQSFEGAKLDQVFFRHRNPFSVRELAEIIWVISHRNILEFLKDVAPERQHIVRFEELVKEPRSVLTGISEFLGLEFHPEMMEPYKDRSARMTDGIHPLSKMLGDVRFHEHSSIDSEFADRWKESDGNYSLSAPTRQMAESLGYEAAGGVASSKRNQTRIKPPLVRIQPHGSKQPFFCAHAAGGQVLGYLEVARRIGRDRPFYAFQATGIEENEEPLNRVEAMAASYIDAMKTVQPAGPYLLGGWSTGGVVAYEMARQLDEAGQAVSLLVLIDSLAPQAFRQIARLDDEMVTLAFLQDLGLPLDVLGISADDLLPIKSEDRLAHAVDAAKNAGLMPKDISLLRVQRLFTVFKSNIEAIREYSPLSNSCPITLLKAAERFGAQDFDPYTGWTELANQGVIAQEVPGNHYTMLKEPHVRVLADHLRARFETVQTVTLALTR